MRLAELLIIVVIALSLDPAAAEFPVIRISYGSLRGYLHTAQDGTEAQIFKKIPFASPPVGALRWKKPQPPKPWNVTIDSTFFGPACAQKTNKYDGPVTGFSEDCLNLNVYTNQRCRESNATCPVVFIIHGGAGLYESTMKFPDETLVRNYVAQDIVVVTTAYRLGMFGAVSLGDENALPANLAMHDVLAALRFTRDEIGIFGGDKERITLMGHSEGGHFALMIAFSPGITRPGEKRLFESVISMSSNGGLESEENTVKRTHAVAKELGCEGTAAEIIECMRPLKWQIIADASYKVQGTHILSGKSPFAITMAGELFPITSEAEMREGTDPMRLMIGTTIIEIEGYTYGDRTNRVLGVVNKEECYEKYLNDTKSGAFVTTYGEASQEFIMTAHLYAKHEAEIGGEVYLYSYDDPTHGAHTEDAFFVLGFHEYELNDDERWLSRVYPRYFSNFIKGERPSKDWDRVKPNLMNYFSVIRNISDDVYPHMKYEYQKNVVQYFEGIIEYDNKLTIAKNLILNAPVQYKSLNFDGDFHDFLESLTIVDALIFFCFLIGAIFFLCCICSFCSRIFCCCCRKQKGCEHESLLVR